MNDDGAHPVDYKTHILIGCTANGHMTVIHRWSHLLRQAEVQKIIDAQQLGSSTYLLCTPTSILGAKSNGTAKKKSSQLDS